MEKNQKETKRAWEAANPEKIREYGRRHYWKHVEQRRAASRAYNNAHKEEKQIYQHEYYLRRRQADPAYYVKQNERNKERQRKKREERRKNLPPAVVKPKSEKSRSLSYDRLVSYCRRMLNQYTFCAMARACEQCPERVEASFLQYPFESFAQRAIERYLARRGLFPSNAAYADCYDAGMLAYLYTVHRCAQMQYGHIKPYFLKMLRIYITDALIVYRDEHNLCEINGFREMRIDLDGMQRYV